MSNSRNRYCRQLSIEEIAEGITACLNNARTLIRDATLLLWLRRHPRALTCLSVANEELGKVTIIANMARIPTHDQKRWSDAWKSFRNHTWKKTHAAAHTAPDQYRNSWDGMASALRIASQLAIAGEEDRQTGLYVDFSKSQNRWVSPSNIGRAEVRKYLSLTRKSLKRLGYLHKLGFFSVKALHIQHEELSEVYGSLPPWEELTLNDLEEIIGPAMKKCIARTIRELGITYRDDITIMGQPWREFIKD